MPQLEQLLQSMPWRRNQVPQAVPSQAATPDSDRQVVLDAMRGGVAARTAGTAADMGELYGAIRSGLETRDVLPPRYRSTLDQARQGLAERFAKGPDEFSRTMQSAAAALRGGKAYAEQQAQFAQQDTAREQQLLGLLGQQAQEDYQRSALRQQQEQFGAQQAAQLVQQRQAQGDAKAKILTELSNPDELGKLTLDINRALNEHGVDDDTLSPEQFRILAADIYEQGKAAGTYRGLPRPAPETRELQRGTQAVTQEFDPYSGVYRDIATGPKWEPPVTGLEGGLAANEWQQLRLDLAAQGYTPQQIQEFMTNYKRYQFAAGDFGKVVYDRFTNLAEEPQGLPPIAVPGSPQTGAPLAPVTTPGIPQTGVPSAPGTTPGIPQTGAPLAPGVVPGGQLPGDINYAESTGLSGFLGNIANTISDLFGTGLAAPETERASQALSNLQLATQFYMLNAASDKDTNMVRAMLQRLTVDPGRLAQGDSRSLEKMQQTRQFIGSKIAEMQNQLRYPQNLKPDDISKITLALTPLITLAEQYDTVLRAFNPDVIVPPDPAIQDLRSNPQLAPEFDRKYGPGASRRYVGPTAYQGTLSPQFPGAP